MGKLTKKDQAFTFFAEGKLPISPELKALGLKGSTRYNYFYDWQKQGGVPSPSSESPGEGKVKGSKVISELAMIVPKEEVKVTEEGEAEDKGEDEGEGNLVTSEPEGKKEGKPSDGKRPSTMVAGQGLTFAITISTKTLMFYQFAASQMEEELNLGDFIDVCVEDTYKGRGLDLGLVRIGGEDG